MPLEVNNNLRQVWSVSDLVNVSRDLLAKAMPFVWVRGEISGFSSPASGHWYFDLKDDRAIVSVAMFKSANSQVPFEIEDGIDHVLDHPRARDLAFLGDMADEDDGGDGHDARLGGGGEAGAS